MKILPSCNQRWAWHLWQHFLHIEKRAWGKVLSAKIGVLNVVYQSLENVRLRTRSHRLREGFAYVGLCVSHLIPAFVFMRQLTARKMGHRQREKRVKSGFCLSKKRTDTPNSLISSPSRLNDGGTLQSLSPKIKVSALLLECSRNIIKPVCKSGVWGHHGPFLRCYDWMLGEIWINDRKPRRP